MQDDKKKLTVLATLGVLLLGLGAFTLMPQGSSAPPGPQKSGWKPPEEPKEEAVEPPRNPTVVAALPRRDPFEIPGYAREKEPPPQNVAPEPEKANQIPSPNYQGRRRPRGLGGRLNIGSIGEEFGDPLPPTGNQVEPARPNVGGPDSGTEPTVAKVETPPPPEPTFDYSLNGVILGRRPAAVLRDKQGNQRLVTVGGMIDGDSTLIEVRQGAAIVDVRGKRRRIELNGDSDAK